jgi:hypothetical protein
VSVVVSSVVSAGVVVVEQSVVEQLVTVVAQLVEELVLQLVTVVVHADTAQSATPLPLQSEHAEPAPTLSSGDVQAAKVTAPARTISKISPSSRCIGFEDSAPAMAR